MDKQKVGKTAARYEAAAKKAPSKKQKELLSGRADVFRFIEARLGEKPLSLKTVREAVGKATRPSS